MLIQPNTKHKPPHLARPLRTLRTGLLLLAVLLALQSCIQPDAGNGETGTGEETGKTFLYETMNYTYKTDETGFLQTIVTGMDPQYLVLANKTSPLGADYIPDGIVRLTCATNPYNQRDETLNSRAANALYAMLAEMAADGVTDIFVTSSYRSYDRQQSLFYGYIDQEMSKNPALTREQAEQLVLTYSAYPGTSEHQTGLCVDFGTNAEYSEAGEVLTEYFEKTAAFRWLIENCYRFGFILRYPEDKVSVTGYTYEPWHYRFVGREAATEIMLRGLCLEEFLNELN